MSPSFKLIEQVKIVHDISTNWACFKSEDNRIAILSLAGVYIWELSNIKDNTMTITAYKKKFIPPSMYNPSLDLGIDALALLKKLPREDIYETVLRTDLTPMYAFGTGQVHTTFVKYNALYPINCWWSTEDVVDNNQCVLAVLSHYFGLNVYRKRIETTSVNNYVEVCNVSKIIVDYYKRDWVLKSNTSPKETLEELKFRIRRVSVVAATWTNLISVANDKFVVLIVALSYGSILFLKFPQLRMDDFSSVNLSILAEYKENDQQISSLHWVNTIENNNVYLQCNKDEEIQYLAIFPVGLLYLGTVDGTLSCVPVTNISLKNVEFSKQLDYLTSGDNMPVTKILHSNYNNYFYIFLSKGNNFIVILSDSEGTVLDISCLRIGTMQIIGLELLEDNRIMLVTQVGIIKELRIHCKHNKLDIEWKYIYIDMNWKKKKCNGWFISKNEAHFGFLTTATQMITSRDRILSNPIMALYVNRSKDLVKILQDNKESLRNYWDCLETIRICTLLDKHDYYSTAVFSKDYNEMSLIQLKTNFYLSSIFEYVKSLKEDVVLKNLRPSKDIMCIINIKIAIFYLHNLYNQSWSDLNDFQKQSSVPSLIFLKEMIAEDVLNKLELDEPFTSAILDLLLQSRCLSIPEPLDCLFCGEKLVSSSCIEKHHDCRCGLSQMQIEQAKFICPICRCPIHEQLRNDLSILCCPFCDAPMDFVNELDKKLDNNVELKSADKLN